MLNIIRSDLFKIRKGKAFYGVMIGILGTLILVAGIFKVIQSPAFRESMTVHEEAFDEGDIMDVEDAQQYLPTNGGEFLTFVNQEVGGAFLFFLLPFIIAVFGADYSSGAYRNLLSYHSGREGIYAAKIITSIILTVLMLFGSAVFSIIIGAVVFGFGGFTGAVLLGTVKCIIMMLPILVSLIAAGHCVLAFTKKTSATIAFYLVGLIVWSLVLEIPAMLIPNMEWLLQLDFASSIKAAAQYAMNADVKILIPMLFSFVLIAGTYVLGVIRYKTTDFDFD